MRVLVTGGTGLVGSHVIEQLGRAGHRVVAMVRDAGGRELVESLGAEATAGRVEEESAWSAVRGVEAVVHAAAIITARRRWEDFAAVNVDGARWAALAAARCGARLVHISSVAVYGRPTRIPQQQIDEATPWIPLPSQDFYARSKRAAEEAVETVRRDSGLSAASLRPCVVYGERDRTFLPRLIRALRFGVAPLVGDGDNPLALVYAGSVAQAVLAALEHPEAVGAFNTTNDGTITQREFFRMLAAAAGRRIRFIRLPLSVATGLALSVQRVRQLSRPGRYPGLGGAGARFLATPNPYTSERARHELRWHPSLNPSEALLRSVRWQLSRA